MDALHRLDKFHKTMVGYLVFGLAELVLAYVFALWAIDNGNVWLYLITVVFFASAVQDAVKLLGKVVRHYVKAR